MSLLEKLLSVTIFYCLTTIVGSYAIAQPIHAIKADIKTPQSSKTEFYVRLDHKPKKHNVFFLNNPNRLVIDVMNMRWKANALSPIGIIQKMRYGKRPNGTGRIVLDLKEKANLSDFSIAPHPRENGKWLLKAVLNHGGIKTVKPIKKTVKKPVSIEKKPQPKIKPKQKTVQKKSTVKPQHEKPLASKPQKQTLNQTFKFTSHHKFRKISKRPNEILVVIDAGHGGNDPGAISKNRRREKDIVLRYSKELYRKINATKGMRAVLTRDRDFYIPLAERVAIAQHYKADLFLSIHADALQDRDIKGSTIYSLSDTASDAVSAQIAKNENRSDIIAGVKVPAQEIEVADILLDLLRRETDGHSYEVAEQMVQYMGRSTSMMRKPHRKAGFAVLKAPDIPSVLIELGYLTNAKDEQNLINRSWRSKMAFEMVTAIKKWHIHRRKGVI